MLGSGEPRIGLTSRNGVLVTESEKLFPSRASSGNDPDEHVYDMGTTTRSGFLPRVLSVIDGLGPTEDNSRFQIDSFLTLRNRI